MGRAETRRGATAVEFALVLPVLMTIVLGCVDYGRLGHSYIAVTNAARAGAGYGSNTAYTAATYNSWVANVRQAVVDEMGQLYGFDATKLTVTTTVVSDSGGTRVQVTVSYPFTTVTSWPGLPTTVTLAQKVEMEMTATTS